MSVAGWIDCAVSISERGEHGTAHYVFGRKVLRMPSPEAFRLGSAFRSAPLDRESAQHIHRDWWRCDRCTGPVDGGVELCESCQEGGTR